VVNVNPVDDLVSAPPDVVALANRLRPVLLQLNRELRREVHSLGVTGGQVSLLIQIKKRPGVGVRELAQLERMSPAGMSKFVTRLEEAGLVTRTPGADRRRVGLAVSTEGDRVLRSVKNRRTAWLAERLRGLEAHELAALDAAVEPLIKLVGDAE
jgi:DNA-binding MarR family transcriptional regulator